jgi:hypothetical protein
MKIINKILTSIALIFSMLFVGVGYAQISDDFEIKGLIVAEMPNKVFMTAAIDTNQQNATCNSKTYSGTVLNSTTIFNANNGTSKITYELTFYNGSNLIYEYVDEVIQTHSNNNVTYTVTNLLSGTRIEPKSYVTAYLFFESNVTTTLNSIINFKFAVANLEDNVGIANHESLVEAMVDDPTNGLNNPDSYLNEQIEKRNKGTWLVPSRDTLGSMAITQGNTLESMFGDSYATNEKIAFIIKSMHTNNDKVADYYYLFTTSVILGANKNPNYPIEELIYPIYRTKVVKDDEGKWTSEEVIEGYAPSSYYEESQPNLLIDTSKIPAFDVDNWKEGKIGTSFDNAAWTSVNQTSSICCEAENYVEKRYFKVTVPSNSNYSFVIDSDSETSGHDVTIEVYTSDRVLINSGQENVALPRNSSNMTYFIVIYGSITMDFKFVSN